MTPATVIELAEVPGAPRVKMSLPSPLRIGDRLNLGFILKRQNGGRSEVLDVKGEYRVRALTFDATSGVARQHIVVEAVGKAPSWRAVKKGSDPPRRLAPTRYPRTVIT